MHAIKSSGISGRLYLTKDSPRWQLKFYHPSLRKRQRVSLGTENLEMAKAKAKVILNATTTKGIAALKDHAMRATALPVGKAIDHYLRVSKIASRRANVNCLLIVLRTVLGGDNDAVRAKPLSVISPALVAKYREKFQGSAYSVRTNLAATRAIFAHPLDWEGFELPDSIAKFAAATKGMKAPVSTFVRIPPETLEKMDASSRAIGGATRRAYLLTRYLGMTPKEVAYCRKGWIEDRGDRHVMVVIERSDEKLTLKTGAKRGRVMAVPAWMVPELMEAEDFMVVGHTKGMREKFMERNFNLWVREFLPDRRSAAYELRRQAGSDVLNETGKISVVQHMLGHKSPSTTSRFYATYDTEVDLTNIWDQQ
jgi:integrase